MSENNKKVYVDGIRIKSRQTSFGEVLALGINADKVIDFLQKNKNESGYVNIDILPRKEVGTYGETHSATLNTWVKPGTPNNGTNKAPTNQSKNVKSSAPKVNQNAEPTDF